MTVSSGKASSSVTTVTVQHDTGNETICNFTKIRKRRKKYIKSFNENVKVTSGIQDGLVVSLANLRSNSKVRTCSTVECCYRDKNRSISRSSRAVRCGQKYPSAMGWFFSLFGFARRTFLPVSGTLTVGVHATTTTATTPSLPPQSLSPPPPKTTKTLTFRIYSYKMLSAPRTHCRQG